MITTKNRISIHASCTFDNFNLLLLPIRKINIFSIKILHKNFTLYLVACSFTLNVKPCI